MSTKNKIIMFVFFSLLLLPPVSAYNGYYWYSPSQLLDNEWFVFALIFLVMFAITFFALGKTMKENKGAAAVIAIVIALFISVAISRRTYFYGYVGETIGNYLLALALILGVIILIKFITGIVGGIGLFIALVIVWFILRSFDPYDFLPYEILNTDILPIYEFLAGSLFLIIIIVAFVLILLLAYAGEDDDRKEWWQKWLWGKRKQESYLERLLRRR